MKRLLCALLTLMLLVIPAMSAMAEADVNEGDVTVSPRSEVGFKPERRDMKVFAAESGDAVTISGNRYTVDTGLVTLDLDLDPSLGYLCVTQDFLASLDTYFQFSDPEGVWNLVVENEMHFLFLNTYSNSCAYIWTYSPDSFSKKVGTLSEQSAMMQEALLSVFAKGLDAEPNGLVTCGSNVWMRLDDVFYFTFVEGQVVQLLWEGNSAMTSEDAQDVEDLLSCLTITAD
ncbi:MAG: hypothetical protein IJH78_00520 [Clostridia bacterium]|nr:hypothetical protein [Clostridia bacterium]